MKLMAPVGWAVLMPATPVTVAVRTLTPLSVGLAEAAKVISGAWAFKVRVSAVETPAP